MLNIDNKCYIDVEFDLFEGLVRQNFVSLIVEEDGRGVVIPKFELTLRTMDRSLFPSVSRIGLKLKISYGTDPSNVKSYTFLLISHLYKKDREGFNLVLSGFIDIMDFINKPEILSIKGTSDTVLKQLKYVTPLIDYVGKDEQVWIRHNITEKNFIDRILRHAFISEKDLVIGALTLDKELIVKSAKKCFQDAPKIKFSQPSLGESPDTVRFEDFDMESDQSIWSKFISEGRGLNVTNLNERDGKDLVPNTGSVYDGSIYSYFMENVQFAPVIDMGNTHENYYQAWLDNLSRLSQFMMTNVSFSTIHNYLNNDKVKLLDTVDFNPTNITNDLYIESIKGKYILVFKRTLISQKGFNTDVILSRDFHA